MFIENVGGSETHHPDSLLRKPTIPPPVVCQLTGQIVVRSINFNGKLRSGAEEVEHVGANGVLAPEANVAEPVARTEAPAAAVKVNPRNGIESTSAKDQESGH